MTERTIKRNLPMVERTDGTDRTISAHQQAQALFQLRLGLKALTAVMDEDSAIAHPSGISINLTAFHDDALTKVCDSGTALLRASLNQVVKCFMTLPIVGEPREIVSVLRAIRTDLEMVAQHLDSRPFTNDRRMMASLLCVEACDLCALAIQHFAINNFREIES
jgi:hypothetical protein